MNSAMTPSGELAKQSRDYARVERAIRFLESNQDRQPELSEVAASVRAFADG